jgi:hypothetical protein
MQFGRELRMAMLVKWVNKGGRPLTGTAPTVAANAAEIVNNEPSISEVSLFAQSQSGIEEQVGLFHLFL